MQNRKGRAFKALSPLDFIRAQIERLVRVVLQVAVRLDRGGNKEETGSSIGYNGDNRYSLALRDLLANRGLKTANRKKIPKLIRKTNDPEVYKLLKECEVEPDDFRDKAFYKTEKCINFVFELSRVNMNVSKFNEVAFAAVKTILLCYEVGERLRKCDIEAAIIKGCKPAKGREKLIHEKRVRIAPDSGVQVQLALEMGVILGYLREETREEYTILQNAILKLSRKKFKNVTMP